MTVRILTDSQVDVLRSAVAKSCGVTAETMRDVRQLELAGIVTVGPVDGIAIVWPTSIGRSILAAIDRAPKQRHFVVS